MDGVGHPLAVLTTPANVNEGTRLPRLVDAVVPIKQSGGRPPRRRPDKLIADKAYDSKHNRRELEKRGIIPRIAVINRAGKQKEQKTEAVEKTDETVVPQVDQDIEKKPKLGLYRWKVERTFSWLRRFRRLRIRDESQGRLHRAFLLIACSLINWRMLSKNA